MANIISNEKLYNFRLHDGTEIRTKGQFNKWCKQNNKYHIVKPKDVEIERKRIERNRDEKQKVENRKLAENVYREVKQMQKGRKILWT